MTENNQEARETQIYAFVEGLLQGEELRAFEADLAGDPELRAQVDRARELLGDLTGLNLAQEPARDLWPDIQARLEAAPTSLDQGSEVVPLRRPWQRRVTLGVPQLIAAGIAVVLLSGGGTWLAVRAGHGAGPAGSVAQGSNPGLEAGSDQDPIGTAGTADGGTVLPEFASSEAFRDYDRAVEELQTVLDAGRDRLSPETIEILEESLTSIDIAIRDSRRALSEDPESGALYQLLGRHLKTKLDLLRRTAAALQSNA